MDLNLNHSGDILEDLLGNNKEYTIALRDGFKNDSKARFRMTMIIAGLIGLIGFVFLFIPFIPGIITLWILGMTVGIFVAGLFGMLFAMPVIDSVSVHLKVIDYVDTVIRNTNWSPNNLMDGSVTADELIEDDEESEEEDDEDEQEDL